MNELLTNEERQSIWKQSLDEGERGALIRFSIRVEDLCFRRLKGLPEPQATPAAPPPPPPPVRKVQGNVINLFEDYHD